MKRMVEDGSMGDSSLCEDITVDPVVRGFIRDWDAMEDLLSHVLYTGLGWEIGNEGQILFTDPLSTPKVSKFFFLVKLKVHYFIEKYGAEWSCIF
jgi:actin-related protein 7